MTLKKLQPRAHWYALVCIATYLSGCAITDTNDLEAVTPEPIAPTVQAVILPNPTGITADVSPEIVAARAAGLPYPIPNATFLASEKATYAAAQAALPQGAQQANALQPVVDGQTTESTPATGDAEKLVVENSEAHAAAQQLALAQPAAKTTELNNKTQAATLPGVQLKTGLEGTPEETPTKKTVPLAPTKAILPTLASYAAYSVANDRVSTKCFPGRLRKILGQVHHRFGKKPEVSSGYRSAAYNRRIGGSRGSYHTKCQAADIKVRGVDKYVLAKYIRSLPDRGGVGVYGCKGVVHVDVGPRRNWYYRCRKRRRG